LELLKLNSNQLTILILSLVWKYLVTLLKEMAGWRLETLEYSDLYDDNRNDTISIEMIQYHFELR
jgi:hypothetical protein